MQTGGKKMMRKEWIELVKNHLCLCGCGKHANYLFATVHYAPFRHRFKFLTKEKKEILLSFRKHSCLCGCGIMVEEYSKWHGGHWQYGIDGYKNRYLLKKEQYGHKRGKYPSDYEIIQAHSLFLKENKLDPNLCWACQRHTHNVKAHIKSVMLNGNDIYNNMPYNFLLLCETCHTFQGWSDTVKNWTIEKQYAWLIDFDLYECLADLMKKGATQHVLDYNQKMKNIYL